MTTHPLLVRELYAEAEAARLLRLPQATLHYWLEGRVYRGRSYAPVLRESPTDGHAGPWTVTWAEFIEAGALAQYRRDLRVPLAELRAFVTILRDQFGVRYPLATKLPWTDGRNLVIAAQESSGLPDDLWLWAPVSGQYLLLPAGQAFLDRVEFDDDLAVRWRPAVDRASTVIIDPDIRFGKPSVAGISTDVLWEYASDGYGRARSPTSSTWHRQMSSGLWPTNTPSTRSSRHGQARGCPVLFRRGCSGASPGGVGAAL